MAERQGQQSLLPKDAARASRWAYWETLSWTADTASYILPSRGQVTGERSRSHLTTGEASFSKRVTLFTPPLHSLTCRSRKCCLQGKK